MATPNASFTAGKLDFGGLADGQAWLVRAALAVLTNIGSLHHSLRHCCILRSQISHVAVQVLAVVHAMQCIASLLCLTAGADHIPVR